MADAKAVPGGGGGCEMWVEFVRNMYDTRILSRIGSLAAELIVDYCD